MITAERVSNSIDFANSGLQCVPQWVLDIPGFSTPTIRNLVARLCLPFPGERLSYLEIGAYCGGTACAAITAGADCTIYEDFSQSFGRSDVREKLERNFARAAEEAAFPSQLVLSNAFANMPEGDFDIYFYDGEHSREAQAQALPAMIDRLAECFVFMVDDAGWKDVELGTKDGFDLLKDEIDIIASHFLRGARPNDDKIWHNGVDLYLCEKK